MNAGETARYDMVLDTGLQPVGQIAALLRDALLERDKLKTDKAKAVLQLRALAARVKAAIATEPTFSISVLDVSRSVVPHISSVAIGGPYKISGVSDTSLAHGATLPGTLTEAQVRKLADKSAKAVADLSACVCIYWYPFCFDSFGKPMLIRDDQFVVHLRGNKSAASKCRGDEDSVYAVPCLRYCPGNRRICESFQYGFDFAFIFYHANDGVLIAK